MSAFQFISADSYLALPRDPQPWVIKDLIVAGGLTNIYGAPKNGKSFAAMGMAIAISSGQTDWLGFPILKHGPVAYLQIDTPRGEWADRFTKAQASGLDISGVLVCDMLMTPQYPVNMLDSGQVEALREGLRDLNPVLIVIDTIREAHSGDENDSTVLRNVVTNIISAVRSVTGTPALMFVSHSRKLTDNTKMHGDGIMSGNRGSSYLAGRMDVVIQMLGTENKATAMAYKGRGSGDGRIDISQDPNTGLIRIEGAAAAYNALLVHRVAEMRLADPNVSVNAMAEMLESETNYRKKRHISDDIAAHMRSLGMVVRKVPKRTSKKKK